ncbi:predicted protein [Verticillium alfalfae VaMs.102]|uniref:Predicted protein n=1 Tax=Verticillium alfalfae (strain VaMs.102 / ATCC MYA-4576 / FGSC 10136) TaxID=526221 RepID=C9SWU9_VERA1|nr:predicted protein [Verticillium alfalfae VaMs.102]EEY23490.1 predicted protein [Verticillium alfalfae VaMs.102]
MVAGGKGLFDILLQELQPAYTALGNLPARKSSQTCSSDDLSHVETRSRHRLHSSLSRSSRHCQPDQAPASLGSRLYYRGPLSGSKPKHPRIDQGWRNWPQSGDKTPVVQESIYDSQDKGEGAGCPLPAMSHQSSQANNPGGSTDDRGLDPVVRFNMQKRWMIDQKTCDLYRMA